MPEQETVDYLTVRIASYGSPEKLARDHLVALARELHHSFQSGTMIQVPSGRWFRWDPLARDEQGSKGTLVECYPPDLKLGQKPFKPKPLAKPHPEKKAAAVAEVVPMNGKSGQLSLDDA